MLQWGVGRELFPALVAAITPPVVLLAANHLFAELPCAERGSDGVATGNGVSQHQLDGSLHCSSPLLPVHYNSRCSRVNRKSAPDAHRRAAITLGGHEVTTAGDALGHGLVILPVVLGHQVCAAADARRCHAQDAQADDGSIGKFLGVHLCCVLVLRWYCSMSCQGVNRYVPRPNGSFG